MLAVVCVGGGGVRDLPAQDDLPRAPAATLSPPATPTRAPDRDGFLQRWLILEPIPVDGRLTDGAVRQTVATEYFPDQLGVLPADGDTVGVGGDTLTWHAVDSSGYNVNLYHFAYALNRPTSNVLFWVVAIIDAPREMRDVRLAIGSNAASIWWVNGEQLIDIYDDRQTVVDDGVSRRIDLKEGRNVVRAAIINAGGATDFCARFLDGDYRPIRDLSIRLD